MCHELTGTAGTAPLSRRRFVGAVAIGLVGLRQQGAGRRSERDSVVFVGTYTTDGRSQGIHLLRMDRDTGTLRAAGVAIAAANPSFLAVSPSERFLYAVNELTEFEGAPSGAVSAFAVDAATGGGGGRGGGRLTLLGRRASRGGAPCYVTIDRTGRFALVANYVGGSVAVLPISADGSLGEATSVVQHKGTGPNPERQRSPHAHCIVLDPANRYALVADLGIDRVVVYRFDAQAGTISPAATSDAVLRPGAGPRHLAFHPSGRVVYVTNELDSTLTAFHYSPKTGALREAQTVATLAEGIAQPNAPADVHVSPSGRFVYVSNRGHDSIAVFAIHAKSGMLSLIELVSTGGKWPRNFAMDPTGRFLFVANQRSDSITGFRIDPRSGRLTPAGKPIELPVPVCIRFASGNRGA